MPHTLISVVTNDTLLHLDFLTSGYLATTDRVIHHQAWRKLLIDPFTDPDVNIHLIVRILEAIILAIDPRVAETVVARV